jgi:L-ascorbate metabolism protein UlaG (beta-lactamase superfamily)
MKLRRYGHSVFCIEAGAAKILNDPFRSNNPPRDNG